MKKHFLKAASLFIALTLAIGMTGCSSSGANEEKSDETAKETTGFTITDASGTEYTFDGPVSKIAVNDSGSGGPFMTMAALKGEDFYKYIACMDSGLLNNRNDMWTYFTEQMPELLDIPLVGEATKDDYNVEAVISSGAEVSIYCPNSMKVVKESIQPKLEAAGIKVLYLDYHSETTEAHENSMMMMGKLLGEEEKAQELIDYYNTKMADVEKRVDEAVKKYGSPSVYFECTSNGADEYGLTYSDSIMWGALLARLKANNIAEGVIENYGSIDPEYLFKADPDIIIFSGAYWPSVPTSLRMGFDATPEMIERLLDGILSRPGWSNLKAVKNNDIHVIHHTVSREFYDVCAFEYLAKVLYPEAFEDVNPEETLKYYYDNYLPFDYAGVWFYDK